MSGYEPPFPWIETLPGAAAVAQAGRAGWLAPGAEIPPLVRGVLQGVGVLTDAGDQAPEFAEAWANHRPDIVARAQFYCRAASDIAGGIGDLAEDLPAFMAQAQTFRLFRYETAQTTDLEAIAATAEWVDYLEALSRVEAPILAPMLPFEPGSKVLEIGGNTGLMGEALGRRGLHVEVLDLPAVCALGRQRRPDLIFHEGDGRDLAKNPRIRDYFSGILFKSVLHDWPDTEAIQMLSEASARVPSGGRLVVCERDRPGPKQLADPTMQGLANLVFAPFYRGPDLYARWMEDAGLEVTVERIDLDMPFFILSGVRR